MTTLVKTELVAAKVQPDNKLVWAIVNDLRGSVSYKHNAADFLS